MRLGIVTCDKCPTLIPGERPLIALLRPSGIESIPVIWNNPAADWASFDALLVRSIWDYHLNTDGFLSWLARVEQLKIPVWNPVDVLRWNHHKFYLSELEKRGVKIAPTLFFRKSDPGALEHVQAAGWTDVVVKPAISASGYRTHTFPTTSAQAGAYFRDAAAHGDFLVQPFLRGIRDHGEISLIYFNGNYSHSILKQPRAGEFRVQAEYGGHQVPWTPDERIIQEGERILEKTGMPLLYARVDGLLDKDRLILMELELIEPDLFLETSEGAVDRLAGELRRRLRPSASS